MIELTGIGDFADRRTNKLSGGQTQRARFAIALVSNSDLLVLDEPTVAMDVEGRHQFWTTMREVAASGKTVLFATHYLEEADAYADRIVLMAHGRIVADGPTTEIKALVGLRTIRATLPGGSRRSCASCPASRRWSCAARRSCWPATTPTGRSASCCSQLPGRPRHRDRRRRAGSRPSCNSPAAPTRRIRRTRRRGGQPMNTTYLRYEVLRTLRNRQGYIFSLIFPVILFLVIGGDQPATPPDFPGDITPITYYMVGMLGFGAMGAVLAGGARIAVDRSTGWNRQLRLSPLRPGAYLATKVAVGYLTAALTIAAMYVAGISLRRPGQPGRLDRDDACFILIGLVPFAAIGIWVGHLVKEDAMGPIMGGLMSLFALLGGSWFPISGVLGQIGS